jgi:hypothetical protein
VSKGKKGRKSTGCPVIDNPDCDSKTTTYEIKKNFGWDKYIYI